MSPIAEESRPFASREALLDWLSSGIRAPSADNVHHLRFRIGDDVVELRADEAYVQCTEPHRRLLMQLSFGAVAENLRLALTKVYRTYEPSWFPDPGDPALALRIDLGSLPPAPSPDALAATIDARRTNRRLFKGPPMTTGESAAVAASVSDPDVRLHWFDTAGRRGPVLSLMRRAERLRFADRRLHEELFESIDFAAGWSDAVSERLAPATLEVEPPLRPLFAAMRHWPLMRVANGVGAASMLGLRAGDLPARLAPHVGVVGSRLADDPGALRTGAQFERIWLAANAIGLELQPMVASAVLTRLEDGSSARNAARDRLRAGWRSLIGDETPFVVFRMGRALPPRVVSSRRPIASYLLD
jgi:hypothetical protein